MRHIIYLRSSQCKITGIYNDSYFICFSFHLNQNAYRATAGKPQIVAKSTFNVSIFSETGFQVDVLELTFISRLEIVILKPSGIPYARE